jgi:hypothetical protein
MSTAPTTGINAARDGIADFPVRLRAIYEREDLPSFMWKAKLDDHNTPQTVTNIIALNADNIEQWIQLSIRNPQGFELDQPYKRDPLPYEAISGMVTYAQTIAYNRDVSARAATQAQSVQSGLNVYEQTERNAIAFMSHDELIEALRKMGISKDSSLITSSRSDTELRNVLWKEIGKRYASYKRGGRRRKTKKSKRRARKTRRRHK